MIFAMVRLTQLQPGTGLIANLADDLYGPHRQHKHRIHHGQQPHRPEPACHPHTPQHQGARIRLQDGPHRRTDANQYRVDRKNMPLAHVPPPDVRFTRQPSLSVSV